MNAASPPFGHHLVGHEHAVEQARAAFASGRMHHAWLLAGADGIGKASLAWHIANHVLSNGENPIGAHNPNHRVTKLIQAEAHPDLLLLRRGTDEKTGEPRNVIPVDEALKVAAFLRMTATHGGWRVVLIDEAHRLNRNGENAILKILEEPPPRALIVITVTTPGALLPTIRSRCRVLHLAPLAEPQMKAVLARAAPQLSAPDMDRLIALAGGSAGFALKIARSECLPLYDELQAIIGGFPALEVPRLHKFADQISRKADSESYEVLRALLLDRVRAKVFAAARQRGGLVDRCLAVFDRLNATFALADNANLDRKLAFIRAIGDLREANMSLR